MAGLFSLVALLLTHYHLPVTKKNKNPGLLHLLCPTSKYYDNVNSSKFDDKNSFRKAWKQSVHKKLKYTNHLRQMSIA